MKPLILTPEKKKFIQEISNILIGLPYKFGAEVDLRLSPSEIKSKNIAFDCSELVEYIYYQLGYKIPDGSYNQYDASIPIEKKEAQIGDLVFRRSLIDKKINHVGIIVSESRNEKEEPLVLEANQWFGIVLKRYLSGFSAPSKRSEFAGIRRLAVELIKVL